MTDLYILDTDEKRWKRPLYEGSINVRAHSAAILHDKIIVFGGVRDKKDQRTEEVIEQKISKKLFFLNVLQIKEGVSEGMWRVIFFEFLNSVGRRWKSSDFLAKHSRATRHTVW